MKGANDLAEDLSKDEDWRFLDEQQQRAAARAARNFALPHNPSAGAVMRHSFIDQHPSNSTKRQPFDKIRVQPTGGIDISSEPPRSSPQPPKGQSPDAFIRALFDPYFADDQNLLRVDRWGTLRSENREEDSVYMMIHALHQPVCGLVSQCPYLLRKPWPLMFISLFLDATEVRKVISQGASQGMCDFNVSEKSKKSRGWEKEAQILSSLSTPPRRWIGRQGPWMTSFARLRRRSCMLMNRLNAVWRRQTKMRCNEGTRCWKSWQGSMSRHRWPRIVDDDVDS